MTAPRDVQRARVYAAIAWIPTLDHVTSIEAARAWVDRLTRSDWWVTTFPHVPAVSVQFTRGHRWASGDPVTGRIRLPGRAPSLSDQLVLHELAHVVAPAPVTHGPDFVTALHTLLGRLHAAPEAPLLFAAGCRAHLVRAATPLPLPGAIAELVDAGAHRDAVHGAVLTHLHAG